MIACHLHASVVKKKKPAVFVSKMSRVPLELMTLEDVNENLQEFLSQKFPEEAGVNLTN